MTQNEFNAMLSEMDKVGLAEAMTRNEYSDFMTKGIKGLVVQSYAAALAKTTFQELVTLDTSDSNFEEYPSIGEPEYPKEVAELGEFEQLNPGTPDNVKVTNFKYGGWIGLSTEAAEDDKSPGKALSKQANGLGSKHARFKDKVFYSIITTNGTIYDADNFFAMSHPGYTGGGARANNSNIKTAVTLSANAFAEIIGVVAKWEGANADQDLGVEVTDIVCPVILEPTAFGLTRADLLPIAYAAGGLGPTTVTAGGPGMPSSLKLKKIGVISSYRLDKTSATDWYVKTNFPGLLYQRRKGLVVTKESRDAGQHFERGTLRWKTEERFGRKVINWRCMALVS